MSVSNTGMYGVMSVAAAAVTTVLLIGCAPGWFVIWVGLGAIAAPLIGRAMAAGQAFDVHLDDQDSDQ